MTGVELRWVPPRVQGLLPVRSNNVVTSGELSVVLFVLL